jgi:hypothetical protein
VDNKEGFFGKIVYPTTKEVIHKNHEAIDKYEGKLDTLLELSSYITAILVDEIKNFKLRKEVAYIGFVRAILAEELRKTKRENEVWSEFESEYQQFRSQKINRNKSTKRHC